MSANASLPYLATLFALQAIACRALPRTPTDPLRAMPEARLPAASGWVARGLLSSGSAGLTHVSAIEDARDGDRPAVLALDDRGRCWRIAPEDGGWSAWESVHDRGGLTTLARGEVDPRNAGMETFVGGAAGNLYLVRSHPQGAVDARLIAYFPDREIRAALAGDLDPFSKGDELIVFTHPKGTFQVRANGPNGTFTSEEISGLDVGVRDALLLPFEVGHLPTFASASRSGRIEISSLTPKGPRRSILFDGASGATRLALAPARVARGPVLYSCLDDGRVQRHERRASGDWLTETLHSGFAGPAGLAAGTFDSDPSVETLAVFTANGVVTLLSRHADQWRSEILFEDTGRGTYLATCELDGSNTTDEILACGTAGRVILLSRNASGIPPEAPTQ